MYPMSTIYAMRSLGEWMGRNAQVCTGWRPSAVTENANPIRGYKRHNTRQMHSTVGRVLHCVASIACAIPMATISSK